MSEREYLQVSEVMTRRPVVTASGTAVVEASKILQRHQISSLLVVEDKKVLGILTLEDIVWKVVARNKDPVTVLVDDVMSKHVIAIPPTQDISKAMELLNQNDIKQLPVISGDELVGFLTLKDLLRIEPAMMDLTLDLIHNQEEQRQKTVQKLFESEGLDIDEDLFE